MLVVARAFFMLGFAVFAFGMFYMLAARFHNLSCWV